VARISTWRSMGGSDECRTALRAWDRRALAGEGFFRRRERFMGPV
jgi:hypothetical protein